MEINGNAVVNMPHNNVVDTLKNCPPNAEAIFVIQRISAAKAYPSNEMTPPPQSRMYHQGYAQQHPHAYRVSLCKTSFEGWFWY